MFHGTRLPLQKWFLSISLMMTENKGPSVRSLAALIEVDKNTASHLSKKLREAMPDEFELMSEIAEKLIGPEYRAKVAYSRLLPQ
jgi:hypothetical protein